MSLLAAVLFLGLLIFVHEAGHFVVAKLCRVHVEVFSFGFGRRIAGFTVRGTDYRLSLIPFGGYVRLKGADPFAEEEGQDAVTLPDGVLVHTGSLQSRPVSQRLLIYAAGPAANVVLPYFLFVVLLMGGEPQVASVVGTVVRDSPAAAAGIRPGDEIVGLGGDGVATWSDLVQAWTAIGGAGTVPVRVVRDRRTLDLTLALPADAAAALASPEDAGLRMEVPSTEVAVLSPASPAGRAGLRDGDVVTSVDDVPVGDWYGLARALEVASERVELGVDRKGEALDLGVEADPTWLPPEAAGALADAPGARWGLESATLLVAAVSEGTPAFQAGIRPGAVLVSADGRRIAAWSEVLAAVAATWSEGEQRARPIEIGAFQEGTFRIARVQPEVIEDTDAIGRYYHRPILGVVRSGSWAEPPSIRVYYPFGDAVVRAGEETVHLVTFTVQQIARLVTGEVSAKDSLGGPVEIMRQASRAARAGIFDLARLLGMISISVGIFNLLPVPVLDGGHLLFYGIEAVRGRPVSPAFRERAQMVGVMLLVALMLLVLVLDVGRWAVGS